MSQTARRADYRAFRSIPTRWMDNDAYGHVNNVVFYRYLESARVAYVQQLGLPSIRNINGIGFILQHAECRFRRPVIFPDTLKVTARLLSIETDRFTLSHEIFSTKLGEVAALGKGTIVTYDYAAATKVPIPAIVREGIERLERQSRGS
jgi:acyl-CoA thioester hydrolase